MKNQIFATLSALTLLSSGAALAQSGVTMQAEIPFEFHVGNVTLPAGRYDVRPQMPPGVLFIRSIDGKAGTMILAKEIESAKRQTPKECTLVFHRYGDTRFLSTVWTAGYDRGRALPETRMEREYAQAGATDRDVTLTATRR